MIGCPTCAHSNREGLLPYGACGDMLLIVDRRSANGTHLNGEHLKPDQPCLLRDGDEFRLGTLVTHIYFR